MNSGTRLFLSVVTIFSLSTELIGQIPIPDHVVIVIEENHNYSQIVGSAAAPYINALIADGNAALFTQSYALTHPSQPNYLMLFSGSNQGITNDNLPTGLPFKTSNLAASLIYEGKTFAGYSEDLPYAGFTGTTSGAYARKHNPWVNWQGDSANGIPSGANLPLTSFPSDYDSLPVVSFVIPNQNNDMHNGTDPTAITTGDTWLHNHMDSYIQWTRAHNSLFILTFDEGTTTGTNQIVTLFIGEMVKRGQYNETINHYSVLRTLEDMFGLPYAGNSSTAVSINDCWNSVVGVTNEPPSVPATMSLEQNYPNPFNPATNFEFRGSGSGFVSLKVYDVVGRTVATIVNEELPPGVYYRKWDASKVSSGIYFYTLTAGKFRSTKKMLVIK